MGQKVTDMVAEMRSLPAGIDQRSPARHPDWLGPDDLSLKIQEVREATNYQVPIQLNRLHQQPRQAAAHFSDSAATAARKALSASCALHRLTLCRPEA